MTWPIPIPLDRAAPLPDAFVHRSTLHGQRHVGRVMVHALRLLAATGQHAHTTRLWAAVYLHDLARTHDGRCYVHGAAAVERLKTMPDVRALFADAGVREADHAPIATAVTWHSKPAELDRTHAHWGLTALLKDADGLDRVRLGDLDPRFLRWPESHGMVGFAERLFAASERLPEGPEYFARLLDCAAAIDQRAAES